MRRRLLTAIAAFAAWLAVVPAHHAAAQSALRRDAYGDPLPPGAVLRLGTTRLQAKGGFGWTPDGKSLVTMKHGTVFFWDIDDGHCHETMSVPIDPMNGSRLALSADGKTLVCTDRVGAIAIWNLNDSKLVSRPAPGRRLNDKAIALSPNGFTLATLDSANPSVVQFLDTATSTVRRTVKLPPLSFPPLVFSPDNKWLAIGNRRDHTVLLVDATQDAEPIVLPKIGRNGPDALTFTPDGKHLYVTMSVGIEGLPPERPEWRPEIRIWNVAERQEIGQLPLDHSLRDGGAVAFSRDGSTLVTVHGDRLLVSDVATQAIVKTIDNLQFTNALWARVAIDPLGKFVAVNGSRNYVRVWDLKTGQPHLSTDRHHQEPIYGIAWSPDGKTIATGDMNGEIRLWNAADGKQTNLLRGPGWGAFTLRFSHDGRQLFVCGTQLNKQSSVATGIVQWFDVASGKLLREQEVTGQARLATLSPDQSLVALAIEQEVDAFAAGKPALVILEAASRKELLRIETASSAEAIWWTNDGKRLLSCNSGGLLEIEVSTGKLLSNTTLPHLYPDRKGGPPQLGGASHAVFASGRSEVVTCGGLPEIYGWSLLTGQKRWTIQALAQYFRDLAISPDESIVACLAAPVEGHVKVLRLLDIAAQRELAHFDLGLEQANSLAFSPDGSRVLIGLDDGTAMVYDVAEAVGRQ